MNQKELAIERSDVHVSDRENGNPVLKTIDYVLTKYKVKEKYITNKLGRRILSSYKYQMVGQTSIVYDKFIESISQPSLFKCIKVTKNV